MSITCAVVVSFLVVVSKGSISPSSAGLAIAYIVQVRGGVGGKKRRIGWNKCLCVLQLEGKWKHKF